MRDLDAAAVGQTVLLVEDEASVRRALGEVLRRSGYHVLKASEGAEALRIHKRHRGTIHAVVTDVQMPGMTGVDLAARLRELQPGLRVLFACGSVPKSISFARIRSQPGTAEGRPGVRRGSRAVSRPPRTVVAHLFLIIGVIVVGVRS